MKKTKCPICLNERGRRVCAIKGDIQICSQCCAEIRNSDCGGCIHYAEAEKYAISKMKQSKEPHFIAEINPVVDEAVDNAMKLAEGGDLAKCEEQLAGLLKKYPHLHIVHFGMGTLLAMKGDHAASISHFDKCIRIFPYFVEAWFNKGASCQKLRDIKGTILAFQKVVELGNEEDDFVITARDFLRNMETLTFEEYGVSLAGHWRAMEVFEQALSDMQNRHYDKAERGFRDVLKAMPKHVQSYGNLGLCFALQEKRQEALSAYDKALELDPDYGPAITNREVLLSLREGETMARAQSKFVEYYKDQAKEELSQ